jgi:hypothetical protein
VSDPILYYVPDQPGTGRIVAIAPTALRDEDRLPDWREMRITDGEWQMLTQKEVHTNWYVALDSETGIHSLQTRLFVAPPGISNITNLMEAKLYDNPDLIITISPDGYIVLDDDIRKPVHGVLDFWLVEEQNQNVVLGHQKIDLKDFDEVDRLFLFMNPDVRTTIYYHGLVRKILDARPT